MRAIRAFFQDQAGAVTIDWVTLTAGILLVGIMVVYSIFGGGVSSLASDVSDALSATHGASVGAAPNINQSSGEDSACNACHGNTAPSL